LSSILILYNGDRVETRLFRTDFRALAWDSHGPVPILVGNGGEVIRIGKGEILRLNPNTKHNLRAVSVNPTNNSALIVGNVGTALLLNEDGNFRKLSTLTTENLRAVSWNPKGDLALIAGNNGALMKYYDNHIQTIDDGRANLRDISWQHASDQALLTSNCFAEEFIPSPNLFTYETKSDALTAVNEGRSDLIGVDWRPDDAYALVLGYDVVWHNGLIAKFHENTLSPIKFENNRVYPVAVRWDPKGKAAAIATATAQAGAGKSQLSLWDGESFTALYSSSEYSFSRVSWAPDGFKLAAIASTDTRTFNC
jgi:WD40 repeat protein